MHRRINITLPEETVDWLDRVAHRGERSHLIDQAIRHFGESLGRAQLRKRLKESALRRGELYRSLAEEWFNLDEEAWARHKK